MTNDQQQQESQRRADLTKRLKDAPKLQGKVMESEKEAESKEREC
jgi:hypothetical protein